MRFWLRVTPVVLVGFLATVASGQIDPANSDVFNTVHNLDNLPGISVPLNQVCLPCHVPHYADPYDEIDPLDPVILWNHDQPDLAFTMYTTLNDVTPGQPEGPSKMCLGCHDGVTAMDNYGGTTGGTEVMVGSRAIGQNQDLSDDHPIGITYPDGNPSYNLSTTLLGVQVVTIDGVDRVECTSCHEPHNNSLGRFLRRELSESQICLECHIK
ncbi:MAG: cytochrome c3 family protein [Phycisphaerales bacterium]|nr:MAG: cytochrome c3 family protein [Phycisphaerales bacterium]